tara:strand:+ start:3359 stop:4183 length:825 start_codon:yes stop_codon:yes gene_type:complete
MHIRRALTTAWIGFMLFSTVGGKAFAQESTSEPAFWVLTSLEPPFSLRNDKGQLEGYLIEVVNGILAEAHIEQEILSAPWERLIQEAQSKPNVLVFPLARTPDREDDYHWVLPLTANIYGVLGEIDNKGLVKQKTDLNKVSPIGVLKSDFRHKVLLKENIKGVMPFDDYSSAVSQLLTGKLKSLFFSDAGLRYYCFKQNADCSHIKLLYEYETLTSYIALSKGTDTQHIGRLTEAATRFLRSPKFAQIQQRWLSDLQAQGPFKLHVDHGVLNLW